MKLRFCILLSFLLSGVLISAQESNHDIRLLLIYPSGYGANSNFFRDDTEGWGWDFDITGTTDPISCCSWTKSLGAKDQAREISLHAAQELARYDAVVVLSAYRHVANPYGDLISSPEVTGIIQDAVRQGKPVWATCSGVRVLAAADVINGVRVSGQTQFLSEYTAAGAIHVGMGILPVIDRGIITSTRGMYFHVENHEAISTALQVYDGLVSESPMEFSLESFLSSANHKVWGNAYGSNASDGGKAICKSEDGSYVVAGYTYANGSKNPDVLYARFDAEDEIIWSKTFGGPGWEYAHDVQQCSDGGYIIIGYTTNTVRRDKNILLIKTNSEGEVEWSRSYGGDWDDIGKSVVETEDQGFIFVGTTYSETAGFNDIAAYRVDSGGEQVWMYLYGEEESEMAAKVIASKDGNYFILGSTGSMGAGNRDIYLLKMNPDGRKLWHRPYGTSGYQDAFDLCETSDGSIIIAGSTDIHGTELLDAYMIKVDPDGTRLWAKRFESDLKFYDYGKTILENPQGYYIMAGLTKNADTGRNDAFFVITDPDGNEEWSGRCGKDMSEGIEDMIMDDTGNCTFVGYTTSVEGKSYEMLTLKLNNVYTAINQKNIRHKDMEIRAYPNPFRSRVCFKCSSSLQAKAIIQIYDQMGNLVKNIQCKNPEEQYWDGRNDEGVVLSPGVYYCTTLSGASKASCKIVKSF